MKEVPNFWLSAFLFLLTLAGAIALVAGVVAMPWFAEEDFSQHPICQLFAKDMTVRRTGFFCGMGLFVTAFVFFKPKKAGKSHELKSNTKLASENPS